jgi:hypothetical protein
MHAAPAGLAAVLFASVIVVLRQVIPSTEILPVFVAIALFCAGVAAIGRYDPMLRTDRLRAMAFTLIALLILTASSVLYLLRLQESAPPSAAYAAEGEHVGELARLSIEHRYWMDGALDQWAFVLFNQGLFALGYEQIPVQEKGLLYFYAALLRLAGDFNTYLLVVASCAAQVLSSWLLLRVAAQFAPPRAAFGAAALLLAMPDALYWGALIHKDNFIVCLVLLCLWSGLKAFAERPLSWRYSALFAGSLVALSFTRSGLVVPLIFGGALAIVLARRSPLERMARYGASVVAGVALMAAILPLPVAKDLRTQVFDRLYYKLTQGSSYKLDVQNITFRTTAEESLVYRLSGGDLSLKKLHYVPVRVAMYFVAPFPPWPVRSQLDYFVLLSTWILIPLWFFFLKGCWKGLRQGDDAVEWALCFFVVIAIAVAFAGGFVHERYRLLLMPFYLSFASLGESASTRRQKLVLLAASLGTFLLGLILYWILK